MKLLCPVETSYNSISHYICRLLAHPLLYLLYIRYFNRATQPVSCQELLSLVSRHSGSGYSNLPNAPTSTGPRTALSVFLAWPGQSSWHASFGQRAAQASPPHHISAAFPPSTQPSAPGPEPASVQSWVRLPATAWCYGWLCPPAQVHTLKYKPLREFVGSPGSGLHAFTVHEFSAALVVSNLSAMQEIQEIWVWSPRREGPLEKGLTTHSSILA